MTQRETLYKAPSVKHYDDGYTECPECEGTGEVDDETLLLNGEQTWMTVTCFTCHGDGQVPVVSEDKDGV
jgi:DnaJ-class molecular chaperone